MRVDVVNTGTELLLGTTVNTHAAWLGEQLFAFGLRIARQQAIPDGDAIREALEDAFPKADLVFVTGGLGPTSDDLTREVTAELLGLEMERDAKVERRIRAIFKSRNRELNESTLRQANVPVGMQLLWNDHGTAPGLYLHAGEIGGRKVPHVFLLPGPPRELYPMFESGVKPLLTAIQGEQETLMRELKFYGIGESEISEKLEPALSDISGLEIGYCAKPSDVNLRLIGTEEVLKKAAGLARNRFGEFLVCDSGRQMEEVIVHELTRRDERMTMVESCTGGFIAHRITSVSGASAILDESYVTYANRSKTALVEVPSEMLEEHGAVSEPVARAMAEGGLKRSLADHALSITGIAGPTGGSAEKPVGTVFIGLAGKNEKTLVQEFHFPVGRDRFKILASQQALDMLRRRLFGLPPSSR